MINVVRTVLNAQYTDMIELEQNSPRNHDLSLEEAIQAAVRDEDEIGKK